MTRRNGNRDDYSRATEAIARNSGIPLFPAVIPFEPMLASTAVTQSPKAKKKNPVDAILYSVTKSALSRAECCTRPSRIAKNADRCQMCGRDVQRSARAACAARRVLAQPPGAALAGRGVAEGDRRSRCRRPGLSVWSSGIRLSRIPQCQAFPQLTPRATGSTGVPDSLDAKQASTSGRAGVSGVSVVDPSGLVTAVRSPCPLLPPACFLNRTAFACGHTGGRRAHAERAENGSTCINASGKCVPIAPKCRRNYLELARGKLLCGVRDRVTFVVSPGKPETATSQPCRVRIIAPECWNTSHCRTAAAACRADRTTRKDPTP